MRNVWKKIAMALLLSSVTSSAFAADIAALSQLFSANFRNSFYNENRCGENTEKLARLALKSGVDTDGAMIVHLTNEGNSNFGLVGAFKAREQGRLINQNGGAAAGQPERHPGTANWEYHAFLLADGQVFDFDFENFPRVLNLGEYAVEMLLPPQASKDPAAHSEKWKQYKVALYRIRDVGSNRAFAAARSEIFEVPIEMSLWDLMHKQGK